MKFWPVYFLIWEASNIYVDMCVCLKLNIFEAISYIEICNPEKSIPCMPLKILCLKVLGWFEVLSESIIELI